MEYMELSDILELVFVIMIPLIYGYYLKGS